MKETLEKYLSDTQLSLMIEIDNDGNFFGMPKSFGEGVSYIKGKIIEDGVVYASSSSYREDSSYIYYENFNICNIDGMNFSTEKMYETYIGETDKHDYDQRSLNSVIIYGLLEKYQDLINDLKYEKNKEEIIEKYNLNDFELGTKNKTR